MPHPATTTTCSLPGSVACGPRIGPGCTSYWSPAVTSRTAGADAEISGLVLQTWRDGWTYCKASKKVVARYQWLPWLGGATAVVSALTGTTVFMTLQSEDSTVSRILVASVALFTAAIAALQAWTTSRVKGLNEQAKRFTSSTAGCTPTWRTDGTSPRPATRPRSSGSSARSPRG